MDAKMDLDNSHQLELIARTVIGLYELTEMIHVSHLFGYPGTVIEDIAIYVKRNTQSLKELIKGVGDKDTSKLISQILDSIQLLLMTDKTMKKLVENLAARSMKRIRKSTKLSLQKQDKQGRFTSDASPPIWTGDQKYKALVDESSGLMKTLVNQIEMFFDHVSKLSNGSIPNWAADQRKSGRFRYIN